MKGKFHSRIPLLSLRLHSHRTLGFADIFGNLNVAWADIGAQAAFDTEHRTAFFHFHGVVGLDRIGKCEPAAGPSGSVRYSVRNACRLISGSFSFFRTVIAFMARSMQI